MDYDDFEAQENWDNYGEQFQPLPSFDNVVVPEKHMYTCANCGQQHEAELVNVTPIGDMKVQLQYRAIDCPAAPALELGVVEGGPVVREAHDG